MVILSKTNVRGRTLNLFKIYGYFINFYLQFKLNFSRSYKFHLFNNYYYKFYFLPMIMFWHQSTRKMDNNVNVSWFLQLRIT